MRSRSVSFLSYYSRTRYWRYSIAQYDTRGTGDAGRGGLDLVHAAVRRNLGKSDTFSQIQTAYHADAADIRPRRSLVDR